MPNDFTDTLKVIKRQIGFDRSFHFQTQAEFDKLLSIADYDLPPFNEKPTFGSFRNALEGWLTESGNSTYGFNHNGVHRWMGGTMLQVQESFHDPVFLVHHCNVDRMFTLWQKKYRCDDGHGSASCYRPGQADPGVNQQLAGAQFVNGRYALVGSMFNDPMFPWRLKPSDVLKAEDGYTYLEPLQPLPTPAPPPPPPSPPPPRPPPPTAPLINSIDSSPTINNPPIKSLAAPSSAAFFSFKIFLLCYASVYVL